jgi:hypothetical protein
VRLSIDSWDPAYGASGDGDGELEVSLADIDYEIELPVARWRALDPDPALRPPATVLFVDGVRRIDARAWVRADGGSRATEGLCASYAAGVIRSHAGTAGLVTAQVLRGLFTTSPEAADLPTRVGTYAAVPARSRTDDGNPLTLDRALQDRLAEAELSAAKAAPRDADDLLVVDGPLGNKQHLPRTLGLVKTHRKTYLQDSLYDLVAALAPGQRTPAFRMGPASMIGDWKRDSWYLRLPCDVRSPWAGIVRVECRADDAAATVELASLSQATLARYASQEHKDPRAPQNLYPIAGLERELRRRLGHPRLLYRALRLAAHTP